MGKEDWIAVSKKCPCPVCGKPDNCKLSLDGRACFCGRVESRNKQNAGGQWLHFLDNRAGLQPLSKDFIKYQPATKSSVTPKDPDHWEGEASRFEVFGQLNVDALAEKFQISVDILRQLHVGTNKACRPEKWTFPERDSVGRIVGITCRDVEAGVKKAMTGCKRGLTYSREWHKTPGPIYLPEGASDTAVLMQMVLCAVGRVNDTGRNDWVADLIRAFPDRQIIVMGENDQSEKSGWPGKKGAIACARYLANALGRNIHWALPPAGYKDVRAYHIAPDPKPDWKLDLNEVEPGKVEPFIPNSETIKTLERLRPELVDLRLRALEEPGIYFDGSPTGAGKSHADLAVMREAKTSLILLPTHANGDELTTFLRKEGFEADKVPVRKSAEDFFDYEKKRDSHPQLPEQFAGICTNMKDVKKAEQLGLSPGVTICPTCSQREECDFLEKFNTALAARHLVTTHDMFAAASAKLSVNRNYIAIHEDPASMIRPIIVASETDLKWISDVAAEGSYLRKWLTRRCVDLSAVLPFDAVYDKTKDLLHLLNESTTTSVFRTAELPCGPNQRHIYQACESLEQRGLLDQATVSGVGMRLVLGLLSGKISHYAVRVTNSTYKPGEEIPAKAIVGVSKTQLPQDRTIVIADATGSAEGLEELIGRPINDRTPAGCLKRIHSVVQATSDLLRSTRHSTVIGLLTSVAAHRPHSRRIGIIGLSPHIKHLREHLPDGPLSRRITKMCYFGEGPDRASNQWHMDCDLLVVLGTPRVPMEAVNDELIRRDRLVEALEVPMWEERL